MKNEEPSNFLAFSSLMLGLAPYEQTRKGINFPRDLLIFRYKMLARKKIAKSLFLKAVN